MSKLYLGTYLLCWFRRSDCS